jgi:hypothetical protein
VSVDCFGKQCYGGVTMGDDNTGCVDSIGIYPMQQNATYKCISYQYMCLEEDAACTVDEIKARVFKWRFAVTLSSFCVNLLVNPAAKNVSCCDDNLCNVPEKGFCPYTEDLECLEGIVNSTGPSSCANESLLTSKKVSNSTHICISFQHKCIYGDSFCTTKEIAAGTKKWIFTSGTKYDCSFIQGSLNGTDVSCCSINNCNHPWLGYCGNDPLGTTQSTAGTFFTRTSTGSFTFSEDGSTVNYLSIILLLISYLIL